MTPSSKSLFNWNSTPKDESFAHWRPPRAGEVVSPEQCQEMAIRAAGAGLGNVSPNPLVGAVIVDAEHRFLAAAGHERYGDLHAEMNAFRHAASSSGRRDLTGCTVYSTLEPCAHEGRTPSCAKQLVALNAARVIYGVQDPNPLVNGRGAEILEEGRVEVVQDPKWKSDCATLTAPFLWSIRNSRPFVALKAATSLDGKIARTGDQRQWLTDDRARQYGHFLRVYYDAIAIGRKTLELDNPTLDARDALVAKRAPRVVVFDAFAKSLGSRSSLPKIFAQGGERILWLVAESMESSEKFASLRDLGVNVIGVKASADGRFALPEALTSLYSHGVQSLLLEGGSGLYSSFIESKLVNRFHLFKALKLYGSKMTIGVSDGNEGMPLNLASPVELTPLGRDLLMEFDLDLSASTNADADMP